MQRAKNVLVYSDTHSLAWAVAEKIVSTAKSTIETQGSFSIALAGGKTPLETYKVIAEKFRYQIDWNKVHFFWGDEQCVTPDYPNNNFRAAQQTLLSHLNLKEANLHRILTELTPTKAAQEYETMLRAYFKKYPRPSFDLVLLGMGSDGHTASLFPGAKAIFTRDTWAVSHNEKQNNTWRVTLTPPLINVASQIVFVVSGNSKAETLSAVLHGSYEPDRFPAQIIQPDSGNLFWMVDEEAAHLLPS